MPPLTYSCSVVAELRTAQLRKSGQETLDTLCFSSAFHTVSKREAHLMPPRYIRAR